MVIVLARCSFDLYDICVAGQQPSIVTCASRATLRPAAALAAGRLGGPVHHPQEPGSTVLSKELRKRGWSFVRPTTIYAFMQAVGLVDDHVAGCFAAKQDQESMGWRRDSRSAIM